jgi:IS30 family transposase
MEHSKPDKIFENQSVVEKAHTVSWNEEGLSYRVIAALLMHDKATINRVVVRSKQHEANPLKRKDLMTRVDEKLHAELNEEEIK